MAACVNALVVFGMCKNCKCVIVGDDDNSQGFCTDECWEEWKASITPPPTKDEETAS